VRSLFSFSGQYLTIAIVGIWYLLTPPMAGQHGVDTTTPLSSWTNEGTYNSQTDCQAAKANMAAMFSKGPSTGSQTLNILAIERSQCVAANDYRLESGQSATSQPSSQPSPALGQQQSPAIHY
jgi:hypothetical protein